MVPFFLVLSPMLVHTTAKTTTSHEPATVLVKSIATIDPIQTTNTEPLQRLETVETTIVSTPAPKPVQTAENASQVVTSGCGDNFYANFIYMKESGCSTTVTNSGGCLGIGQACPGSKLTAVCPSLDYSCENAFFTSYADKYGGWAGSYAFWLANGWW